ncbi:HPP family-domain-containing protein [Podospora aff. communis PSN243]|uniref:HPP family-domain-containing protein n=1 Tax=Podospora aff. communis PSN243 TaxID=3040156 RepID=A0AAV9G610_9PEZI|nr:HPP family-domain-containing protein [Podospora aff. communis PSN243]
MGAQGRTDPFRWHVDIDRHLNPLLPASILPRLPHPVAHFLGYRSHPSKAGALGNVAVVFWAAIGVFASLAIIGGVARHIPSFAHRAVPTIVGSFGAAAVLDFYAIESPLAQPRNAVFGQLISAIIGVAVCKLFALSPHFQAIRWIGASLACAAATAVMGLTGTVHPPAGATALMAVLDDDVANLGWFLLAPIMLGCGLMLATALLVNNIQRRFPYYWWSPEEMGTRWKKTEEEHKGKEGAAASTEDMVSERDDRNSSGDLEAPEPQPTVEFTDDQKLFVSKGHVQIPSSMYLTFEEKLVLETLSQRL